MTDGDTSGIFAGIYPTIGPWTTNALWSGLHEHSVPTAPIETELPTITRQRLTPLLLHYLRRHAPDRVAQLPPEISRHAFELAAVSSLVLAMGAVLSKQLADAGIPNVAVKGPAIALTYPSWQERPFADLDLYVAKDQFRRAASLCRGTGMAEDAVNRQPRDWFNWTCLEALNLVSDSGASIDLHHHVPPWFWGQGLRGSDLIARGRRTEMLGHEFTAAPPEDNLLVAALHVVSDKNAPGATLMIWRDLAQLAAVVDIELVVNRAQDADLAGWLLAVLDQLPAPVRPSELVAALQSTPTPLRGRRRLERLLTAARTERGVVATQSLRLPAWRAAAFAAGTVFPSRAFLCRAFPEDSHPRITWWRRAARR